MVFSNLRTAYSRQRFTRHIYDLGGDLGGDHRQFRGLRRRRRAARRLSRGGHKKLDWVREDQPLSGEAGRSESGTGTPGAKVASRQHRQVFSEYAGRFTAGEPHTPHRSPRGGGSAVSCIFLT